MLLLVVTVRCSGDSRRYLVGRDDGDAGLGGEGGKIGGAAGDVGQAGEPDPIGTAGAGLTSSEGGTGGTEPPCLGPRTAPEAPLRRLRHFEYDNSVLELGDSSKPSWSFPPEALDSFSSVADSSISTIAVEKYFDAARDFGLRATADASAVQALTGCDPAGDGEATCRQTFVRDFIGRAFRRPATASEIADFETVFDTGQGLGGDFESGVRAVVEVALQSPEFLYHVELGEPPPADEAEALPAGWARPTPYEMANRLSYFFWGAPPDAALLEAAERGELRDKDEIENQARRMVDDQRARATVRRFYFELLDIPSEFITLDAETGLLANAETEHFIDAVTWEGPGDFRSLLTAPFTFMNEQLASHYGIAGVTSDAFQRVDLDPTRRGGLLTHASFLASTSVPERTSPTRRGFAVLRQLLCRDPVTPPFDIPVLPPPEDMPGATTRQRLEAVTADPVCAGCHAIVDPVGFAFEHYDWAGRFRETDNGSPIDASGSLETNDGIVTFNGAIELAALLAESREAEQCFVANWMTFAHGRQLTEADACSRRTAEAAFADANGNVRELLIALTQTDAFLYRPALPEQP